MARNRCTEWNDANCAERTSVPSGICKGFSLNKQERNSSDDQLRAGQGKPYAVDAKKNWQQEYQKTVNNKPPQNSNQH